MTALNDFELQKAVAKKFYAYVAFKPLMDCSVEPPAPCQGIVCMTECWESRVHDFLSIADAWPIIKKHKIVLDYESTDPIKKAMIEYLEG